MTRTEITYHEGHPAIDVKDHGSYNSQPARVRELLEALPEGVGTAIYESLREDFWIFYAPEIAKRYGYGEVFSEGRSGGWLTVQHPPIDEDDAEELCVSKGTLLAIYADWANFEIDIEREIKSLREVVFPEQLEQALVEHKTVEQAKQKIAAMDESQLRGEAEGVIGEDRVPRDVLEEFVYRGLSAMTTIGAYMYKAALYSPASLAERMALDGWAVCPGELDNAETAELMLDELAEEVKINREDERTFDSGFFPKIVFNDQLERDEVIL